VPLRAVVFDFDGVIANTEPLHLRAFQQTLVREGIALTERDYYDRYLGYDDAGVFRIVATEHGLIWNERHLADLVAAKALALEALGRDVSVLFPGAADAIRRAAAVAPVAIASGAIGPEIRRVLTRERLDRLFSAIVAAEDTVNGKPFPDPYIRAVELLREAVGGTLDPRDCLAVEDSRWGLDSARAAGLRTVAVAQSYDAATLRADIVIPTIAGLDLHLFAELFAE
jgi:beta-phosphoglucomutase